MEPGQHLALRVLAGTLGRLLLLPPQDGSLALQLRLSLLWLGRRGRAGDRLGPLPAGEAAHVFGGASRQAHVDAAAIARHLVEQEGRLSRLLTRGNPGTAAKLAGKEAATDLLQGGGVVVVQTDALVELLDLPVLEEDLGQSQLPAAHARRRKHAAARLLACLHA